MWLLGMMSAAHVVIPLGLFAHETPPMMLCSLAHKSCASEEAHALYSSFSGSRSDPLGKPQHSGRGVPLSRPTSHVLVFTDASLLGWGGTCLSQVVGAQWPDDMTLHIKVELLTELKVSQHFSPLLKGQHALIHTDNRVLAVYINRQGGSTQLLNITRQLLCWARVIPSILNRGADILFRGSSHHGDWSLHPELVAQI